MSERSIPNDHTYLQSLQIKNFKRFADLTINLGPLDSPLLVCGENNAGKTQVLWALLLFFRACNLRQKDSFNQKSVLNIKEDAATFLHPFLEGLQDYKSFVTIVDQDGSGISTFKGIFSDSVEYSCSLKANGILDLHPPNENKLHFTGKIGFAMVLPAFQFMSPKNELDSEFAPNNNFRNYVRVFYRRLPDDFKSAILKHMQALFPNSLDNIIVKEQAINVLATNGAPQLEVMFSGSAFQKIFSALVIFYRLLGSEHHGDVITSRYFLIEEPEALLYPSLVFQFYNTLRDLCLKHKVKLIVTSHDFSIFNATTNRLALSAKVPTTLDQESDLLEIMNIAKDKGILFVDGPTDVEFVKQLLCPDLACVAVVRRSLASDHLQLSASSSSTIAHLMDPEFCPHQLIPYLPSTQNGCSCIYWELPCIESFFILHYFLTEDAKTVAEGIKKYFQDDWMESFVGFGAAVAKFAKQTVPQSAANILKSYNPNVCDAALLQLQQQQPDYVMITRAIRAHTFVKKIMKTNTTVLLKHYHNPSTLHPNVQALLQVTIDKLRKVYEGFATDLHQK
eukprot:TRINITY_DN9_c0_g1_i2.p1 TRINITY_DN9_c0_g1~~TRINITY_DN9_c0_g1_i2.p1  ORF type:complete len:590 (-),score=116.76 TRINITY_DN9_c0_g1_i2:144-1835(-)